MFWELANEENYFRVFLGKRNGENHIKEIKKRFYFFQTKSGI